MTKDAVEFRFPKENPEREIDQLRAELTPGKPILFETPPPLVGVKHLFQWTPGEAPLPLVGYQWRIPEVSSEWQYSNQDRMIPTTEWIDIPPNSPLTIEVQAVGALSSEVGSRSYTWSVPDEYPNVQADFILDAVAEDPDSYVFEAVGLAYDPEQPSPVNGTFDFNLSLLSGEDLHILGTGSVEVIDGDLSLQVYDANSVVDETVDQTFTLVLDINPLRTITVVKNAASAT